MIQLYLEELDILIKGRGMTAVASNNAVKKRSKAAIAQDEVILQLTN